IQYARNPSPVNLSNQPPDRRIPLRTEDTNRSITAANRSNRIDSFISAVDSRMSAAITNIWIASPSITASSSSAVRNRCSQSGGACGSSISTTRARSRSRPSPAEAGSVAIGGSGAGERPRQPVAPRALGLGAIDTLGEQVVPDVGPAVERPDEPEDRV